MNLQSGSIARVTEVGRGWSGVIASLKGSTVMLKQGGRVK